MDQHAAISTVKAWKVKGEEIAAEPERLATESLLILAVNGLTAFQLLYLPGLETELVVGFLLTSGIIEQTEDIAELRLMPVEAAARQEFVQAQVRLHKTYHNKADVSAAMAEAVLTGAGGGEHKLTAAQLQRFPQRPAQAEMAKILALMAGLPERQEIFRLTGATHAIFLAQADSGEVILGAEDVGRHNAFDKVIGQVLMQNLPTGDKIALLSGRASFEMVFKAARAGIPMIASVSAPTSLAVRLAHNQDITLMGFVRGPRCNIYTHPQRLINPGAKWEEQER